MSLKSLGEKGNLCLQDRENIPSAPIWHMGKVHKFNSKESFDLLKNTIYYLECKARLNKTFSENEKEFMKELFESMWWGGKLRGYHEAAKLANHYVNGNGTSVRISSEMYKKSVIVSDAMIAMKAYIKERAANNPVISMKSNDPSFLKSRYVSTLKKGVRSAKRQGYMDPDKGNVLLVEQLNLRLKYADNKFHLSVRVTGNKKIGFTLIWSVKNDYDYTPFKENNISDLAIANGLVLKLHDGLSHHLDVIGVAQKFKYSASWTEKWAG